MAPTKHCSRTTSTCCTPCLPPPCALQNIDLDLVEPYALLHNPRDIDIACPRRVLCKTLPNLAHSCHNPRDIDIACPHTLRGQGPRALTIYIRAGRAWHSGFISEIMSNRALWTAFALSMRARGPSEVCLSVANLYGYPHAPWRGRGLSYLLSYKVGARRAASVA
jgi:hypothetical protein